ncbi:MAG: hypothetical protein WBE76_09170, partial [Terracidiphilus sp.]
MLELSTATPAGEFSFELVAAPAVGAPDVPVPAKSLEYRDHFGRECACILRSRGDVCDLAWVEAGNRASKREHGAVSLTLVYLGTEHRNAVFCEFR